MKKFELMSEHKINWFGHTLYRIRACVSFTTISGDEIKVGDLGGWVEKESNLSHEGKSWICGNAKIWGNAEIWGDAKICGDAEIFSTNHVLVIGCIGSRNDFTTFYRDKDNEITVKCGCFLGKIDKFLEKVSQTHGDTKYALVYKAAVEVAKLQIDLGD